VLATRTFECLACGSPLQFNAGSLSTRCGMCDDARPLPLRIADEIAEVSLADPAPGGDPLAGRTASQCTGCRAIVSGTTAIALCPFCGAGTTALATAPALLHAQGHLPFLVDQHTAQTVLRRDLANAGLGAAPALHAVYVPWLLYSCRVTGEYDGRRGDRHDNGDGASYVVWTDVSGFVERDWENKRASGSIGMPEVVAARLEPWDWAFCEPSAPQALADATVEHSTFALDAIFRRVFPSYDSEIASEVRYDIGGDLQEIHRVSSERHAERVRVILLPVWVGRMSDPGRTPVAVNGRTAETVIAGDAGRHLEEDEASLVPDPSRRMRWIVGGAILVVLWLLGVYFMR
jgi:hypothetical protein